MKLGKSIWFPISGSNPYNFLTARVQHRGLVKIFYRGLTRICIPEQDGVANPEIVYWSRDMVKFEFWEKGLGIVSPPHFMEEFFKKKMIPMLYFINWPNFIVWFLLRFEILGNICIAIVCLPCCDIINFEINLVFLIKPFFCMTKKSSQKVKYHESKKNLLGEIKIIFHDF